MIKKVFAMDASISRLRRIATSNHTQTMLFAVVRVIARIHVLKEVRTTMDIEVQWRKRMKIIISIIAGTILMRKHGIIEIALVSLVIWSFIRLF